MDGLFQGPTIENERFLAIFDNFLMFTIFITEQIDLGFSVLLGQSGIIAYLSMTFFSANTTACDAAFCHSLQKHAQIQIFLNL